MTEVWPVSSGEYSDYSVDHLFATKELAEEYLSGGGWRIGSGYSDDFTIEQPMTVIDTLPEPVKWLWLHGDIGRNYKSTDPFNDGSAPTIQQRVWYPDIDGYPPPELDVRQHVHVWLDSAHVSLTVEGSDIERVRKVYSERRAQIVAEFDIIVAKERAEAEARRVALDARMGWTGGTARPTQSYATTAVTDLTIGSQDQT